MAIHRMRIIGESVEIIKGIDRKSAITANCIRSLYKDRKVHCVFTGKKILVDLDMILSNISQAKVKILLDFAALLWLPLLLPRDCNNKITEEPIWQQLQNE